VWSVCTLLYRGYIKALSFIHPLFGRATLAIQRCSINGELGTLPLSKSGRSVHGLGYQLFWEIGFVKRL
jgi:hypothetical protein